MTGARGTKRTCLSTTAVAIAGILVSGYVWLWTRTTTVDLSLVAAATELVVGLLWLAAGAAVGLMRPGNRIAWLLLLAGVLWFVQASRLSNNAGVFALASGVGAASLTVGLYIALALPDGRLQARSARVVVGLALAGNVVLGSLRIATGAVCDWPFLIRCPGSPLAVPGLAEYGAGGFPI